MTVVVSSIEDIQAVVEAAVDSATRQVLASVSAPIPEPSEWVPASLAREEYGSSKTWWQRHRTSGELPYSRIGGKIFYRRADIDGLLERNLRKRSAEVPG